MKKPCQNGQGQNLRMRLCTMGRVRLDNKHRFKAGVVCSCPSAQMSAQYDVLADLDDFEFHILFRHHSQGNPAWAPVYPTKVEYDFLPPYKGRLMPSKLKRCLNGNITGLLDSYDFDAMILHGIYDSSAVRQAIAWCNAHKRPYLLRCDANVAKEKSLFRRLSRRLLIGRRIQSAAGLLYIGTQNRKYYELFGARREQLFLAPWEIDYKNLEAYYTEAIARRDNLRAELGFHNGQCVVVTVSRLLWRKGYDTLIPVIGRLYKEGLPVKLVVVGEGSYRTRIEELIEQYSAPVILCGNLGRGDVVRAMAASDIFVLASYQEPWGLVVNEAALCGLPLVVSDQVGAGADLVVRGENGYIYNVDNQNSMYSYLLELVQQKSIRISMARCSRKIIDDWRKSHPAIEGYESALQCAMKHVYKESQRCSC